MMTSEPVDPTETRVVELVVNQTESNQASQYDIDPSQCCPFDHLTRIKMLFCPCSYWADEHMTKRDCCLCCHEYKNEQTLSTSILMEIGGTWVPSQSIMIPIWWIIFRFISMIYLIFVCSFTMGHFVREQEFFYYFYFLTMWGNTVAMLSTIIKFISTITAYQELAADENVPFQIRTFDKTSRKVVE